MYLSSVPTLDDITVMNSYYGFLHYLM